jgi:hypothetical protein
MAKLISAKNEYKNWFFYKTLSIYPDNIFLSDMFFNENNKLKKDFFYDKNIIRKIIKNSINNKFLYSNYFYNYSYRKQINKNLLNILCFCYEWHKKASAEVIAINEIASFAAEQISLSVIDEQLLEKLKQENLAKIKNCFFIDIHFPFSVLEQLTENDQFLIKELNNYGINFMDSDITKIAITFFDLNHNFFLLTDDLLSIFKKLFK